MDASIAGRAQTLPPTESWGRPAQAGEATLVPPAQSVRPPDGAERARDKKRDRPGKEGNRDRATPSRRPRQDAPCPPPHETAPAAAPSTERVYLELPIPPGTFAAGNGTRFDGLMVRRAYASRDDESPRFVKSV